MPSSTASAAAVSPTPDPTPSPTPVPTATPVPEADVPLAVVTGYTNPRAAITEAEVEAAIDADTFIQLCEFLTAVNPLPRCLEADEVVDHLLANPTDLAFLPAGLVVPTVKVLP